MAECAKLQVDILKTADCCVLKVQKGNLLRYLWGFQQFSYYHILCHFGGSKGVWGYFFRVLKKIWPKITYHTTQA